MRSALSLALAMFVILAGTTVQADDPPNVLFISVDDMRPEIGCYGNTEIITPNFDAFSKTGTTFLKSYCQAAVCAPSRASVMTGLRPDSTRVWDLRPKFSEAGTGCIFTHQRTNGPAVN